MAAAKKTPKKPAKKVAPPGKPVRGGLTALERDFAHAYLELANATQAYLRCKPDVTPATAATEGWKLLRKPEVARLLRELRAKRSEATGINAEQALREAWAIATADPRELVEFHVGCCRFCWGKDHLWQRTGNEMTRDEASHSKLCEDAITAGKEHPGEFDPKGGVGYDARREPHPDCPECFGDGEGRPVFKDTRYVSPAAVSLFAGVKQTKEGSQMLLHSKVDALDKVFKHLGLYEKDNTQKTPLNGMPYEAMEAARQQLVALLAKSKPSKAA